MSRPEFNLFDMAQSYAEESGVNAQDLFKKPEEAAPAQEDPKPTQPTLSSESGPAPETADAPKPKARKPWVPDADLTADMPELHQGPVTYSKEEYREEGDGKDLLNIADESWKQESRETMDVMVRCQLNIEDCKKRRGYAKLAVPEGPYQVRITAAASDNNYERGQKDLDEIFDEIEETYPHFILEWAEGRGPDTKPAQGAKIINLPTDHSKDEVDGFDPNDTREAMEKAAEQARAEYEKDHEGTIGEEARIIVDKSQLPSISWSEDEINKIKKARSIELVIKDVGTVEMGEIHDVPDNLVDMVLSQYQRKTNDVTAALPASQYRCTFVGLSYPEVLDLTNSVELNNVDGERKKWSICFEHIRNQSIGPWEEYVLYKDPATGNEVRINVNDEVPEGVDEDDVRYVSKFEDFMRKTSYLDLDFMLWKILCATAMDKEIISIDCHAIKKDGHVCGKTYDWVYSPADLLLPNSISEAVLQLMEKTGTVSTRDEIMTHYLESPVASKSTVKLNTSGWTVVFGHISAYEYVEEVFGFAEKLQQDIKENMKTDPTLTSRALASAALTVIKEILVPTPNGTGRIKGPENIIKAINKMDEVDWQTTSELVRLMLEPYQLKFVMRDIVCPECKNRSDIEIEDMLNLLFIVARSLGNVQVELKSI